MKIALVSDLHLSHYKWPYKENLLKNMKVDADLLIMAGDIFDGGVIEHRFMKSLCDHYKRIFLVSGNHEAYSRDLRWCEDILTKSLFKEYGDKVVHFNGIESYEYEGHKFVGCTLWFPEDPESFRYEKCMNDFWMIKNFREEVYKINKEHVKLLNRNVDDNTIVFTHHLPSVKCIAAQWAKSALNRYFVTDLTDFIEERQPKYWFHGHSHVAMDHHIRKTRVVCNPHGYPGEAKKQEYKPVVIEVG